MEEDELVKVFEAKEDPESIYRKVYQSHPGIEAYQGLLICTKVAKCVGKLHFSTNLQIVFIF
jgi:hypothetical protein